MCHLQLRVARGYTIKSLSALLTCTEVTTALKASRFLIVTAEELKNLELVSVNATSAAVEQIHPTSFE